MLFLLVAVFLPIAMKIEGSLDPSPFGAVPLKIRTNQEVKLLRCGPFASVSELYRTLSISIYVALERYITSLSVHFVNIMPNVSCLGLLLLLDCFVFMNHVNLSYIINYCSMPNIKLPRSQNFFFTLIPFYLVMAEE
ncbi:hypothetical protein AHAS_Ahas09G0201700 [Arachis hypogaea]